MDQQTETSTRTTDLKPGLKKSRADARGVKRIKRKFPVPQTLAEAEKLISLTGDLERKAAGIQKDAAAKIAKINNTASKKLDPVVKDIQLLYESLQSFAAAKRMELTNNGETKTIKTPAGDLAWRDNPPSVEIAEDKLQSVLDYLEANADLSKFLRQPPKEIDKEALLAHTEEAEQIPNVEIVQGEAFSVKPKGEKAVTEVSLAKLLKKAG